MIPINHKLLGCLTFGIVLAIVNPALAKPPDKEVQLIEDRVVGTTDEIFTGDINYTGDDGIALRGIKAADQACREDHGPNAKMADSIAWRQTPAAELNQILPNIGDEAWMNPSPHIVITSSATLFYATDIVANRSGITPISTIESLLNLSSNGWTDSSRQGMSLVHGATDIVFPFANNGTDELPVACAKPVLVEQRMTTS